VDNTFFGFCTKCFQQYFSYIVAVSLGVGRNRRPSASHLQTLSHNVVLSRHRHERGNFSGCISCISCFVTLKCENAKNKRVMFKRVYFCYYWFLLSNLYLHLIRIIYYITTCISFWRGQCLHEFIHQLTVY
jgi:hypothetical protein